MPQLDTSTFPSQLFWLVVCFLALYFILSYIALPKVARVLEAREETIEAKINKASTFREEAETLLKEYEEMLAQTKEDAQNLYKENAKVITSEISIKQKDVLDKLSDRLHLAEQDLYRARKEAHRELGEKVEEIANLILDKITDVNPLSSPSSKIKKRS